MERKNLKKKNGQKRKGRIQGREKKINSIIR